VPESAKFRSPLIWGTFLILDILIFRYYIKRLPSSGISNQEIVLIRSLHGIMFSSLMFVGVLFYLDEFARVFRTLFILKYLLCAIIFKHLSKHNSVQLFIYCFLTSILLSVYYNSSIDVDYVLFNLGVYSK